MEVITPIQDDPLQDGVKSRCRQLPLEVWEQIIGNITDSRYLPRAWLNFRQVSHTLKAATEHVFMKTHLSETCIIFEPSIYVKDQGQRDHMLKIELKFTGLSLKNSTLYNSNNDRAIFAAKVQHD